MQLRVQSQVSSSMDKAHIDILIQEASRMSYVVLDIGGEKFRVKRKILAR